MSGTHRKYGFPPRDRSAPPSRIYQDSASDLEDGALNTMPSQRTCRTTPNRRIYFERSRRAERVLAGKTVSPSRKSFESKETQGVRTRAVLRELKRTHLHFPSSSVPARSAHSPGRTELDAVRGGRCAEDKVSIPSSFRELGGTYSCT
jgi:hypothetical protein